MLSAAEKCRPMTLVSGYKRCGRGVLWQVSNNTVFVEINDFRSLGRWNVQYRCAV